MLIETAINDPVGSLTKVQYSLDDIRRHQAGTEGRSVLVLRTGSPLASGASVQTFEAYETLSARLALLSVSAPVALMSDEDWSAAEAAHG